MLKLLTTLLILTSFLQAEKIYLIDTPKCRVSVDKKNLKDISLEGYCNLDKQEKRVIDDIKYAIESQKGLSTNLNGYINSHNPKKENDFLLYKINDKHKINAFASMPKYKPLYLHGTKYMFISYRLDGDSSKIVLQKYDEQLYKKRVALINAIPRDINITKVFTPDTFRYYVAKLLNAKAHFDRSISTNSIDKILYNQLSYKEIIKEYKETKVFNDLFGSQKFLQIIPFEEKLKILRLMKKQMQSNYLFSLYITLNHGYRFEDEEKEIKMQLKDIEYILDHYDALRGYLSLHPQDERVAPVDVECMRLINLYKNDNYKKALIKLIKRTQKDINNYSMQMLITVLSDKKMEPLHKRFQKFYKKRLKENKKEVFYLSMGNWKVRTHMSIKIELDAKDTLKILHALQKNAKYTTLESQAALEFKPTISSDKIVKKLANEYFGLEGVAYKVLEKNITIEGKKR